MEKENLNLNVAKASQDLHIPTKITKKNSDTFSDILFKEFNKLPEICKFSLLFENDKLYSCLQERE